MNESMRLRVIIAAALGTFVVGGIIAGHAMRKVVEIRKSVVRTTDAIREAGELQAALSTYDRARERVGKALAASGSGQETLLASVLAELQPEDIDPPQKASAGNGWVKLTQRLTFNNVDIGSVMAFVESAERLRPPWRLMSCDIRASASSAGRGQVVLSLSTVQRAP
jgi:hypothetical protein